MYQSYSLRERIADGCVHAIGLSASVVAVIAMLLTLPSDLPGQAVCALVVYGVTMIAMFGFSAGYNVIPFVEWKGVLRRCDQAAIFVKIAGTYTPFAIAKVGGVWGYTLLVTVWSVALIGAAVKLTRAPGSMKLSLALYLGLGWVGLLFIHPLVDALSITSLVLLVLGGLAYSIGVLFHTWERLPYQNAIWHLFVLAGTALHFAAVVVAVQKV